MCVCAYDVTPGDIAFANCCYCVRTLCMYQCAVQHLKLPFVAYEEARHRKVTGLRLTVYKLQCQSMNSLI